MKHSAEAMIAKLQYQPKSMEALRKWFDAIILLSNAKEVSNERKRRGNQV